MSFQIDNRLSIPLSELDFTYAKSSGPGGQHANKANTKVVLYFSLKDNRSLPHDVKRRFLDRYHNRISNNQVLIITSDTHRDQKRNVSECLDKLKAMVLAVATPPKPRKKTKPHKGAVEKRLTDKKKLADKKRNRSKPTRDD